MTGGQDTWSARCVETRTAGAAGGPGKPTGSNPGRAPWSDPTGRYYRTALDRLLRRISTYLMRWAQRKHKRLRPFRKAASVHLIAGQRKSRRADANRMVVASEDHFSC